jgi:hypothetical protein
MCFMTTDPNHFLGMPRTDGEELASGNLAFPDTSAGGSALGTTLGCDQVRKVLHCDRETS